MTEWLAIPGFDGYEVSDDGRVRNATHRNELGQYDNGRGVIQVTMQRSGRNTVRAVNRLVACTFFGNEDYDYVAMHVDGDYTNNRVDNLVWKPVWFARAKAKERQDALPLDRRGVRLDDGRIFANARECAQELEGLESYVLLAARSGSTTYKGYTITFYEN